MGRKFAFIGAGSFVFTRSLVRDILTFPALQDCTLTLMDINEERLGYITRAVQRIVDEGHYAAKVEATMDRKEALTGADGVLCTILEGGTDVWQYDITIPKKYGVDTCVGDTRGPSGIFRFLRTVNPFLEIARDIDRYCPNAIFLNYTNPMAMLCRAVQGVYPNMCATGLCHSVQGTAATLAHWIGAPEDEVTYTCAGINHQAFYTKFLWNGEDAYPLLRKVITEQPEIYNKEVVRNEIFLSLGYYLTESSGHNSEYNAWFRKRPDLIEKYCTHGTGWNPGKYAFVLDMYKNTEANWRKMCDDWMAKPVKLTRGEDYLDIHSEEYAAHIFNAILGDGEMFKFNGNVRNFNLVDNLPYGACVEVPVLASKHGIEAMHVGKLPPQIALLSGTSSQIEEMVVEGSLAGDKEMIYQAICYDPLTAAVLSLAEIRQMVDEMFKQNEPFLTQFKK